MATQTAIATFNGAQPTTGDQPYVDITWPSFTYSSTTAYRIVVGAAVTDSNGAVVINLTNKATTGVRVLASDQFTGTVELIGFDI